MNPDIAGRICVHLSLPDIYAARLTCKDFAAAFRAPPLEITLNFRGEVTLARRHNYEYYMAPNGWVVVYAGNWRVNVEANSEPIPAILDGKKYYMPLLIVYTRHGDKIEDKIKCLKLLFGDCSGIPIYRWLQSRYGGGILNVPTISEVPNCDYKNYIMFSSYPNHFYTHKNNLHLFDDSSTTPSVHIDFYLWYRREYS